MSAGKLSTYYLIFLSTHLISKKVELSFTEMNFVSKIILFQVRVPDNRINSSMLKLNKFFESKNVLYIYYIMQGTSKELAGEIQQRELLLAQGDIQQRDLLQGELHQRELLVLAQEEIQQRELLHNHDQQRDIISREHHKFVTRDFMQHRLHM